ncbi:histidine kinase [Ferruginibacter sp.]
MSTGKVCKKIIAMFTIIKRPAFPLVLLLITCFAKPVKAQQALPKEYTALQTDTARMRFLAKAIADSLDGGQLDQVLDWSRLGLAMAEKNKVDTMKGIFYFNIGKAYTYKYNKFDSAIFYYKKVPAYFPDRNRKYNVFAIREIMDRYADLGNKDSCFVYLDSLVAFIDTMPDNHPKKVTLSQSIATNYEWFGMFKTAIKYYQVAINGDRQNKNYAGLGLALANLGVLYSEMEDTHKAIQYSAEALDYLADVNRPYMQTAANLASYYADLENYDSAAKYLALSDSMVQQLNDDEQRVVNGNTLARIQIAQKKYDAAIKILDSNLAFLAQNDDKINKCKTLMTYATLDTSRKQYDAAKKHLTAMLDLARQSDFKIMQVMALQNLALASNSSGDYKAAFKYQQEYMRLKDSVANDKAKADLNDLEISYKTLQKEQQIALLKKDNDIKDLQIKESNRLRIIYILIIVFLAALFALIYYQRNRRNKIETEKIKAELQTQVLRSQMNPHFIFNCLNSIENFIMQNDKRQASDYLNKFSLLIRSILDSSRNEVVPIAKDMEALKLYVELEQLRFNNKFSFKVYVDPALSGGDYLVPSLLVQPFVENAIVHGMAHSEEKDLNLTVMASLEGDKIKYTIQDNGIGREKAKVYNMQNKPYHKSVGLKITEERINIYNEQPEKKESINITDLYDEHENPDGTRVEIILKAI